jgi:hypothetical protein
LKHEFKASKTSPAHLCSLCGAEKLVVGEGSDCLAAVHPDPAIDRLYRQRRQAALEADWGATSYKRSGGWADLETIQAQLALLDPLGDWYYEGDQHDGHGWVVRRPEPETTHTEAFAALHAEREAERAAEAQAEAERRAEADAQRLAEKAGTNTPSGAEPRKGAKAMASKTKATEPTTATVDLHKELVKQLGEAGVKVTPKWSPTKKYAAYKRADGKTLAYVFAQNASGIKVKAALTLAEVERSAKKAWVDNAKEAPFSIRGFFVEPTLYLAVDAIKAASAKVEPKKAPAKRAPSKTTTATTAAPAAEAV